MIIMSAESGACHILPGEPPPSFVGALVVTLYGCLRTSRFSTA
jgi:hypothetical protein